MSQDVPVDAESMTRTDHADRVAAWTGRVIVAVCAVSVVIAAFDDRPLRSTLPWGVALVVVVALGLRRLRPQAVDSLPEGPDDFRYLWWWGPALVLIGGLWFGAVLSSPSYFVAVFALYWLIWSTVDLPWAALPVAGVSVLLALGSHHWGAGVVEAVAQSVLSFAMGFAFALYIRVVVVQSRERRQLIEELRSAQSLLATAQHEAGVLAERERLAREIHDTLAQGFTSIVMLCQAGRHERVEEVARENLAEARRLVAALQPAVLDGRTLVDALDRVVAAFGGDAAIDATLEVIGAPRQLDRTEEVALVRATQEALANVRKHADATSVAVRLRYDDPVTLSVTDDGRGFDPQSVEGGFGLRGLRDRVAEVRGALDVRSTPGHGTTVEVQVP